ncbi:hypothetical protein V8C44DRAFT_266592 [Trichoderma aethiopicum]
MSSYYHLLPADTPASACATTACHQPHEQHQHLLQSASAGLCAASAYYILHHNHCCVIRRGRRQCRSFLSSAVDRKQRMRCPVLRGLVSSRGGCEGDAKLAAPFGQGWSFIPPLSPFLCLFRFCLLPSFSPPLLVDPYPHPPGSPPEVYAHLSSHVAPFPAWSRRQRRFGTGRGEG